jgi:hypothetical protein
VNDTGTRFRWASAAGYACGPRGSGQDPDFSSLPAPGSRGRLAAGPLHVRRHSRAATGVIPPGAGVPLSGEAQPMASCVGTPAQGRAVTPCGTLVWASASSKRRGLARDRAPAGIRSRATALTARRTSVCAALGASAPFSRSRPRLARSRKEARQLPTRRWSVHPPALSCVVALGSALSQRKTTLHAGLSRPPPAAYATSLGRAYPHAVHRSPSALRQPDAATPSVRGPRRRSNTWSSHRAAEPAVRPERQTASLFGSLVASLLGARSTASFGVLVASSVHWVCEDFR